MSTTYKKLSSYFLDRESGSGSGSYYYGTAADPNLLPASFNSIKKDFSFTNSRLGGWGASYLAAQPDGKILVAGGIEYISETPTSYFGPERKGLARINVDGTLDTSFVNPRVLNGGTRGVVNALHLQPDGKIIIAGVFLNVGDDGLIRNRMARLNSDGTLETSFNPNLNSDANAMAIQSDGKILVGGSFTTVGGVTRNRIARLNSDGTLDTAFNPNLNSTCNTINVQSDGKILIGGVFTTVGGVTRNRIARLNSDGTLDTSFNPNSSGAVLSAVIQPDEKIIIGGYFETIGGVTRNRIARLNSDGTLDTAFNPILTPAFYDFYVRQVALQADNKIIIVGKFSAVSDVARPEAARLNSDGTLDMNFVPLFPEEGGLEEGPEACLVLPNGSIIFASYQVTKLKEAVNNAPYRLAYTVPESTQVIVKKVFATNHNNFPAFYDMVVLPLAEEAAGISEKHHYVWDSLLSSNGYEELDVSITLSQGDEIYVYSSTDESISFNIFGAEITP
jgi:uncharacterized delta-60 repeat protein